MNYCVPDFGIDEEDSFASSFRFPNLKLLQDEGGDDMAEIIWQQGPIVRRLPPPDRSFDNNQNRARGAVANADAVTTAAETASCELFMGEDGMALWHHYSPGNTTAKAETENQQLLERNPTIVRASSSPKPSTTTMSTQPRVAESRSMASTVVESNVVVDTAPPPLEFTKTVTRRNDIPHVFEKV